jgi:hypothetical protein
VAGLSPTRTAYETNLRPALLEQQQPAGGQKAIMLLESISLIWPHIRLVSLVRQAWMK